MSTEFIALDWGTTSFRAYRVGAGGHVLDTIAARCTEVESGARNVDNILTNSLLPDISNQILSMMATGEQKEKISVTMGEDGAFLYS